MVRGVRSPEPNVTRHSAEIYGEVNRRAFGEAFRPCSSKTVLETRRNTEVRNPPLVASSDHQDEGSGTGNRQRFRPAMEKILHHTPDGETDQADRRQDYGIFTTPPYSSNHGFAIDLLSNTSFARNLINAEVRTPRNASPPSLQNVCGTPEMAKSRSTATGRLWTSTNSIYRWRSQR